MRKHNEYTRRLCNPYKASNDSASPCLELSIDSASVIPDASIFFVFVKKELSLTQSKGCVKVACRCIKTLPKQGRRSLCSAITSSLLIRICTQKRAENQCCS